MHSHLLKWLAGNVATAGEMHAVKWLPLLITADCQILEKLDPWQSVDYHAGFFVKDDNPFNDLYKSNVSYYYIKATFLISFE